MRNRVIAVAVTAMLAIGMASAAWAVTGNAQKPATAPAVAAQTRDASSKDKSGSKEVSRHETSSRDFREATSKDGEEEHQGTHDSSRSPDRGKGSKDTGKSRDRNSRDYRNRADG